MSQKDIDQAKADYNKATQVERDRSQAFVDAHRAGSADLNVTGKPNNTPERVTSHLRRLSASKGDARHDPEEKSKGVLDQPSGKAPELADVPAWRQPLLVTKEGMNSGELVRQGSGMRTATVQFGNGKLGGPTDVFAAQNTAAAHARRVAMSGEGNR